MSTILLLGAGAAGLYLFTDLFKHADAGNPAASLHPRHGKAHKDGERSHVNFSNNFSRKLQATDLQADHSNPSRLGPYLPDPVVSRIGYEQSYGGYNKAEGHVNGQFNLSAPVARTGANAFNYAQNYSARMEAVRQVRNENLGQIIKNSQTGTGTSVVLPV